MIENILEQSVFKNGQEVSFILGQRVLSKAGKDWIEVKGQALSIEEWEDLKDLCLQGSEKIQLETKGFVSGMYSSLKHKWKFSFTEKKECFRAHLSLIKNATTLQSQIESPLFWDSIKKDKGLFIIAGERRQGKTTLLQEIILNNEKNKLSLVGIHAPNQSQDWPQIESVVQLGLDTLATETNHILYEGLEKIVIDNNSIKDWKKWIEFAEQGQGVLISICSNSITTILSRLVSELDLTTMARLINVLNGVLVQKIIGTQFQPCHEILTLKEDYRNILIKEIEQKKISTLNFQLEFKETYQSLNQSIIQKLVRRKIDLQTAFAASDNIENLDQTLKKMGL